MRERVRLEVTPDAARFLTPHAAVDLPGTLRNPARHLADLDKVALKEGSRISLCPGPKGPTADEAAEKAEKAPAEKAPAEKAPEN